MTKYPTILYCICILFASCTGNLSNEGEISERLKGLEEREKLVAEKEKLNSAIQYSPNSFNDDSHSQNQTTRNKYIYVIFKVEEPELHHTSRYSTPSLDGTPPYVIPERNTIIPKTNLYFSDIKEISGYSEDLQYEYMDDTEATIRKTLINNDMEFRNKVSVSVSNFEEKEQLKENSSKILDRKIKVFESYKEASISRSSNKGVF